MSLFETQGAGPAVCRLLLAYDGTGFRGFAIQPDRRTVEGVLAKALGQVLHTEIAITCAGRTDAGVHAWGQVVSFPATPGLEPDRLQASLNGMLGPESVVREAELVAPGFSARRSAVWRRYRYTVVNRPCADPFRARYAWWVPQPLDLSVLRLAADPFMGERDFGSFCRPPTIGGRSLVRQVFESHWTDLGDGLLRYDVRANSFCWQMVRSMVGTMVDVGLGKRRPGDIMGILRQRDRAAAGEPAPPHGLCLWDVGYSASAERPG
ncbi:MAG: tRNA pseudouridine(38-40) synthase TruA [Acidimicrobiia bacterium]